MVLFPGLGGDGGIGQMLISFIFLMAFFVLFPRILLFQILYKMKKSVKQLEDNALETEQIFLNSVSTNPGPEMRERMEPMKNMVFSPPTGIDPAGLVGKLEDILDTSEDKMERFVDDMIDKEVDEEERASLIMSFKGVYGTQQIFVVMRHFKELIAGTKNYQLGGMMQMMLPLYEELAESQKEATEAFVNQVPIGDSVGPLVAAKFMTNDPAEMAEHIVVSEEEVDGKQVFVLKASGPGARLGKYGDAIEQLVEEQEVGKMIFVDAGMRFEGEDTGKVVSGTGVLMGGPGVEKFKIEEIANDHDVPLEGFVVKQSGPQASKPMHSSIYKAVPEVTESVQQEIADTEDGAVILVGVGNTSGIGNSKQSTSGVPNKLKPYWETEEEEATSYIGLMKAFPFGGGDAHAFIGGENTFDLFQRLVR